MFTYQAPAKINWFLNVYHLRNDGFHEIGSLIQKISLYDTLKFRHSKDLRLISDLEIPDHENIVYKTAMLLKEKYRITAGAEIHITKKIPVAAGLGGGSSNAATALVALNILWSLNLSQGNLFKLAGELGSDVPFFLDGPLAFVEGRGEKISSFRATKTIPLLLVKPSVPVSTGWAYRNLSLSRNSVNSTVLTKKTHKSDNIRLLIENIGKAGLNRDSNIVNDLESVTVKRFPVIAEIKDKLLKEGAIFSLMSGSGSTIFGVFESLEMAESASVLFKNYWTAVVQTLTD
jgi:4-diphosphocytidyl-2-C-methyl-D-erythritol kinase